jgi:hypothetical protein
MEPNDTNWQDRLAADLLLIYRDGLLDDIEPVTVPGLAELAVAVSGEPYSREKDYYFLQISGLLRAAIRRQEKTQERRLGHEMLFGIAREETVPVLEQRRDDAAPFFRYSNKDTLRRGEVKGRPFEEVVRENMLRQMLALADERGFVYTARYYRAESSHKTTAVDQKSASPLPGEHPSVEPTSRADATRLKPRRSRRWHFTVAVGVVLIVGVIAFVIEGAFGSGKGYSDNWGPTRPGYDYKRYTGNTNCDDGTNPSTYNGRCGALTSFPVFNSFINTPYYGDEAAFFDGYRAERSNGNASDPVTNVTSGNGIIVLRVYVDNDAQVHEKEPELTTAHNTRVRVTLPPNTSKSLVAYAYISADRAVTVYDSVDLTSDRSFSLEYIPGSAMLYSSVDGQPHAFHLSDEIIGSEGALIGINAINGVLPPSNYLSGVTIDLKVRAVPQASASQ